MSVHIIINFIRQKISIAVLKGLKEAQTRHAHKQQKLPSG